MNRRNYSESPIGKSVSNKLAQWSREAELAFARRGASGEKMVRQLWANGATMVGPEGGHAGLFIPLERAIQIWRAGWKVAA